MHSRVRLMTAYCRLKNRNLVAVGIWWWSDTGACYVEWIIVWRVLQVIKCMNWFLYQWCWRQARACDNKRLDSSSCVVDRSTPTWRRHRYHNENAPPASFSTLLFIYHKCIVFERRWTDRTVGLQFSIYRCRLYIMSMSSVIIYCGRGIATLKSFDEISS